MSAKWGRRVCMVCVFIWVKNKNITYGYNGFGGIDGMDGLDGMAWKVCMVLHDICYGLVWQGQWRWSTWVSMSACLSVCLFVWMNVCMFVPALPPSKTGQDIASVTMKNDSVSKSQSRMAGHAIPCRRHCAKHSGMGLSRQLWLTKNSRHSMLCLCNWTQRAIRVDSSSRNKSRQAWRKDARMERLRSKVWYKRTICSDSPWVATEAVSSRTSNRCSTGEGSCVSSCATVQAVDQAMMSNTSASKFTIVSICDGISRWISELYSAPYWMKRILSLSIHKVLLSQSSTLPSKCHPSTWKRKHRSLFITCFVPCNVRSWTSQIRTRRAGPPPESPIVGICQVHSDLLSGGSLDCGRWSHQFERMQMRPPVGPPARYLLERTRIQEADMSMHPMIDLWFGSFEPKWLRQKLKIKTMLNRSFTIIFEKIVTLFKINCMNIWLNWLFSIRIHLAWITSKLHQMNLTLFGLTVPYSLF